MKIYIFKLLLLLLCPFLIFRVNYDVSFINEDRFIVFYVDGIKYHKKLKTTLLDVFDEKSLENKGYEISKNMPISNNQKLYSFDLNNKISINEASIDELIKLPGIGTRTATLIIEYRNKNNGFKYLEEIKNVKGIKDKKYEKIKEYISL